MKQGNCAKCGKFGYLHKHHGLPQATFGGEGDVYYFCPNCHTEYHEKLGRENLKNPYLVFYFYFQRHYGLLILAIILGLSWLLIT